MERRHNSRFSNDDCSKILHSIDNLNDILERERRPLPVISAMINVFKSVAKKTPQEEFKPLVRAGNYGGIDRGKSCC